MFTVKVKKKKKFKSLNISQKKSSRFEYLLSLVALKLCFKQGQMVDMNALVWPYKYKEL